MRIDGKEYAVRQVVEARGEGENHVQVSLREEIVHVSATLMISPIQTSKPQFGTVIPQPANWKCRGGIFRRNVKVVIGCKKPNLIMFEFIELKPFAAVRDQYLADDSNSRSFCSM